MCKSKLVKYIKWNKKKYESRVAKYVFTNEKKYHILRKCHDWNFEIWVKIKCKSSWKKNLSQERLTSCLVSRCLHLTKTRLQSKVAVLWLPNIADFFFYLAWLIKDSERQLSSASYDSLQFLFWHLDEYARTLLVATLSSRFCETYGCLEMGKFTLSTLHVNQTGTQWFNH